ncbi:peptidase domain-containing ABC transporter [Corallincola holothuriorum]|nr:ATP-binding cassette domain-containing protein [Corallincola holothuriorum]
MMNTQHSDLHQSLVGLFQQLGMYAQANKIATDPQLHFLDTIGFNRQLDRYDIDFSVLPADHKKMMCAIHPFVVIPSDSQAFVARRKDERLEQLAADQTWQPLTNITSMAGAHMVLIEHLPGQRGEQSRFTQELDKRRKWYRPVFWLSLLASITGLTVPLFTMAVYDKVIGGQAPAELPGIAMGAILALAILVVCRIVRAAILCSVSNRMARDLSDMTFSRLLHMPLMVLGRVGISNHIARLRNAERVRMLFSGPGGAGLIDIPFTLIALFTIVLLSGWLVVVPVGMLGLYYLIARGLQKYAQRASPTLSTKHQNSINELTKQLLALKTSGNYSGWIERFIRQTRINCQQNFAYAKRNGLNQAVSHGLSLMTALVTVFTGIFLVLDQSITAGALIASTMLIWRITGPAQLAFASLPKMAMLKSASQQFDNFMKVKTENNELRLEIPDSSGPPSLKFQHVTLRFSATQEPVLSSIDFEICPGEVAVVIGPNQAGKSTLLQAALGVIEPQSGFITINDRNLTQYDPTNFRHWAGYAPAQPDLFPGTLADNLRISRPEATEEELQQALLEAGAATLLDTLGGSLNQDLFEQGYSTLTAIEGSYISLARALLKRSPLLLLDEPIANQNPRARRQFVHTLEQLKGRHTVLFSSHDPELIKHADKVLVLDKGCLVYAGPQPQSQPVQEA